MRVRVVLADVMKRSRRWALPGENWCIDEVMVFSKSRAPKGFITIINHKPDSCGFKFYGLSDESG